MKKVFLFFLAFMIGVLSFGKERSDKTFLIIFDKTELAHHEASLGLMELNISSIFDTKLYTGNSETALIVTVPFADWTVCDMGQSIVKVSDNKELPLEQIAFRIIDMEASKKNFKSLLSETKENQEMVNNLLIKLNL
ncbi:hypothetical protein [uncultured Cyclobacterium sp.]|uniref:hypothetical protein n=1 Tax=uncultured Cyclobacterium sp. TaxID=453820 RepID=UPI0030EE7878|tara:strand:- start:467 stop:877 length:411 start_codon:yes stop_codon:yes gene_type:complete